jgi:hypothetical protein
MKDYNMFNRDTILKDLRQNVIEVTFTKMNGENRIMRCSLRPDILPPSYIEEQTKENTFHKENPEVIAAWDVQKMAWRSFRVDSVSYIEDVTEKYL